MSLATRVAALATRIAAEFVAVRADPRWTNARTPTAHAGSHAANGGDPLTPAEIGAATDTDVVHTSGTETVNGTKIFGSPPQVPVGTQLTHPVRRDDARLTDARPPLRVPNPPVTLAYVASNTPDAAAGNYRICTMTGNMTLNPPANPENGQLWRLRVIASTAQRVLTLASGLRRPAHIEATLTIPSGRRGDVGLLYEDVDGWTVLAAQVT